MGSFSGSEAWAVQVTIAPDSCGAALSGPKLAMAGFWLGAVMANADVLLSSALSCPACFPSMILTSIWLSPTLALLVVQVHCPCGCQSVTGWPFRKNLYWMGSFSASMTSTVQTMAEPKSCGLALSASKLMMTGFWFGAVMVKVAVLLSSNPSCPACFPSADLNLDLIVAHVGVAGHPGPAGPAAAEIGNGRKATKEEPWTASGWVRRW